MRRVIERNPSYAVTKHSEGWFWTYTDRGQGMHGPFRTEREAHLDAEEYSRIQWEWEHNV